MLYVVGVVALYKNKSWERFEYLVDSPEPERRERAGRCASAEWRDDLGSREHDSVMGMGGRKLLPVSFCARISPSRPGACGHGQHAALTHLDHSHLLGRARHISLTGTSVHPCDWRWTMDQYGHPPTVVPIVDRWPNADYDCGLDDPRSLASILDPEDKGFQENRWLRIQAA